MKKLWLYPALLLIIFSIPHNMMTPIGVSDSQLRGLVQPANDMQRIYGVNIAPAIYELVDAAEYLSYVQKLTENGSRSIFRYTAIPGSNNELARNWLVEKMMEVSSGRIEIELIGDYMNIVGRLPGYLPSNDNPVFVVSAHYDTVEMSPGANDDASGIAVLLELSRIMSLYEWPLDIYFVAFNGAHALQEIEIPVPGRLQGSPEVAEAFQSAGIDILAMYDVNTILRQNTYAPDSEALLLAYNNLGENYYHVSQYWAELGKSMAAIYGSDIVSPIPSDTFSHWTKSDHIKFIQAGYSSVVLAFESGFQYDNAYHTPQDVWSWSQYDFFLGSETTALIGASMAYTMGRAYGEDTQLFDREEVDGSRVLRYYFPISIATTINITSRWYGGPATFVMYAPNGAILGTANYSTSHPWEFTQVFSSYVMQKGLYRLDIINAGSHMLGVDTYAGFQTDMNGNGITDRDEYWLESALFQSDSDFDNVSDALEIIYGTDSESADSDNDTLPDAWELERGLDPTDPTDANDDSDGDSLTNAQEYYYGTDIFDTDSDSDGMPDYWEVSHGLNPLFDDANEDADNDRYTNLQEYQRGSDPSEAEVEPIPFTWVAIPSAAVILLGIGVYIVRREWVYRQE